MFEHHRARSRGGAEGKSVECRVGVGGGRARKKKKIEVAGGSNGDRKERGDVRNRNEQT